MVEYTEIDKLGSPKGVAESTTKCSIFRPMQTAQRLFSKFKNYAGVEDLVRGTVKIMDSVRSPFTVFDALQIGKKVEIENQIIALQKQLEIKGISPDKASKLMSDIDDLSKKMSNIESVQVKEITHDAENIWRTKTSLYLQDSLDTVGKKVKIKPEDRQLFNKAVGTKNDNTTIDKILGDKGDNLLARYKKEGKNLKTGNAAMDAYIQKEGQQAVDNIYHISKTYRDIADMLEMPLEARLSNYLPNIDMELSKIGLEAEEELKKIFPKAKNLNAKAFFEFKRSQDFNSFDTDPLEALGAYLSAARKKVTNKEIKKLISLKAKTKSKNFASEFERKRFEGSLDLMIKNMTDNSAYNDVDKFLNSTTKALYAFSLTNNIGSSINNLTSISNIVASKFGVRNTMRAIREVSDKGSNINKLLDSYGIGSAEDAMSVLDIHMSKGKDDMLLKKFNMFNWTEQVSIRTAALAKLAKRYGSMDNALLKVEEILKLPNKQKEKALGRLMTEARQGAMDTIFTNIRGNKSQVSQGMGGFHSLLTMFLKHPTREANFLWTTAEKAFIGGNKKEASEILGRYFVAKTMLLGRQAAFLGVPKGIQDHIDSHLPEVRRKQEELGAVLDAVALPKMAFNQVGIDFSVSQDILWPVEIPFYFLSDLKGASAKIPSLGIIGQTGSALKKTMEGKADLKDAVRLGAALSFIPAAHRGTFMINGVPIGGAQLKKLGDTMVDLAQGKNTFWGQDKPLEGFEDYRDLIVGTVSPGTPSKSETIRTRAKEQKGTYKNYLMALAINGEKDKRAMEAYAKGLGKSVKEARESLRQSFQATFKDSKEKSAYNKGVRTINGY